MNLGSCDWFYHRGMCFYGRRVSFYWSLYPKIIKSKISFRSRVFNNFNIVRCYLSKNRVGDNILNLSFNRKGFQLDIKKVNEIHQQINQKMDIGDFKKALGLTYKIQNFGPHYYISYIVSGHFIDIGSALWDENIIKKGFELLENDYENIIQHKINVSTVFYNLANGYSALFKFEMIRDPYVACFKESKLNKIKYYYKKALEHKPHNQKFSSQIWVNLGNCFDHLGRVVDALECYEEALKCNPNHGMALGNKGMALKYYALLTGEHQVTYLIEAYSLLSQALKLGAPHETVNLFSKELEDIREIFLDKEILDKPPKYPGYTIKADSELERFLIDFCLKNKLYLNICNFCQKCDASIGDTAHIKTMIISINKTKDITDNLFMYLSSYLNQIKQDYIVSRFLLILSRHKETDLNFVDKRVKIIDTFNNNMHNIYIQLVKISFKNFYDILDKIACFINKYLKLRIPEKKVNFHSFWYTNSKHKKIRKKIYDTKNFSLNALFDIHKDLYKGPYKKLRYTRNALTHRFVNVRMVQELEDSENTTEYTLLRQTLELARIIRNAIIYLLYFVHVEERKKEAKSTGIILPIVGKELPDNQKTYK